MKTQNLFYSTLLVFAGVSLIVGVVTPLQVRGRQLALGAICRANWQGLAGRC